VKEGNEGEGKGEGMEIGEKDAGRGWVGV